MLSLLLVLVAPAEVVPAPVRWDVVVMVGEVPAVPRPVVVLPPIRRLAGPPVLYSPPPFGMLATPMLVAPAWGLGSPFGGGGFSRCGPGGCW